MAKPKARNATEAQMPPRRQSQRIQNRHQQRANAHDDINQPQQQQQQPQQQAPQQQAQQAPQQQQQAPPQQAQRAPPQHQQVPPQQVQQAPPQQQQVPPQQAPPQPQFMGPPAPGLPPQPQYQQPPQNAQFNNAQSLQLFGMITNQLQSMQQQSNNHQATRMREGQNIMTLLQDGPHGFVRRRLEAARANANNGMIPAHARPLVDFGQTSVQLTTCIALIEQYGDENSIDTDVGLVKKIKVMLHKVAAAHALCKPYELSGIFRNVAASNTLGGQEPSEVLTTMGIDTIMATRLPNVDRVIAGMSNPRNRRPTRPQYRPNQQQYANVVCGYFSRTGRCRYGANCRYSHGATANQNNIANNNANVNANANGNNNANANANTNNNGNGQ